MSKVKFGLRGFEYGVLDNKNLVPGETKKIPGIKTAKLDITNELNTITADDGPYVVLSSGITGTTLEVSWLDLGSDARKDFYGITVENGVEKYSKKMTPNDIACLFRTTGDDGKGIWVGLLKGKFSLPGMDLETKDGSPDPKNDTVSGSFVARGDGDEGLVIVVGREDNPQFQEAEFRKLVFPKS
jgi:phi13 family phage major tail protein